MNNTVSRLIGKNWTRQKSGTDLISEQTKNTMEDHVNDYISRLKSPGCTQCAPIGSIKPVKTRS